MPSTGVSRASLYQHTIRGSKTGCLSGSNLERSQFYYKHVGCLSGVPKALNEKYEKKGEGQASPGDFSPVETSRGSRTIFLSFSRASCKPPLVTRRRGKTDARDLPPWRLNKLRATNFNRNSDYAEVTGICVCVCACARSSLCITTRLANRFFNSLRELFSHAIYAISLDYVNCYFFFLLVDKHYYRPLGKFLISFLSAKEPTQLVSDIKFAVAEVAWSRPLGFVNHRKMIGPLIESLYLISRIANFESTFKFQPWNSNFHQECAEYGEHVLWLYTAAAYTYKFIPQNSLYFSLFLFALQKMIFVLV